MTSTQATMDRSGNRRVLRAAAAAHYCGLSSSTFAKLRQRGDGPPYIKAGRRVVVYDVGDLDEWLATRRRRSTSDVGLGATCPWCAGTQCAPPLPPAGHSSTSATACRVVEGRRCRPRVGRRGAEDGRERAG